MKVGILTSSRADFGVYFPLVKEVFKDKFFKPEIIAFGTHLSKKFGYTINEILQNGYSIEHRLNTIPIYDSPIAISESIGETIKTFSGFWEKEKFDLVITIGDRFEMFAAVAAGSPFNIKFAHLHAGETTLGAIDNAYRHSISLMSKYLFVSTEEYKKRAVEMIQRPNDVFNVGALSIDNLSKEKLYTISEFLKEFNINLKKPTILTTFHPETVGFENNRTYISELIMTLDELTEEYQIIITMPNSDTEGLMIREKLREFGKQNSKVILVESFGMKGYLSCMKYSKMLIGNTSSAFVEAAFFPKWVINLGDRQNGRINTPNMYSIPIAKKEILKTVKKIESSSEVPDNSNIYGDGSAAKKIVSLLKELHGVK